MNECNSVEATNTYSNLSHQTKFTLNEINEIKDYFYSEIEERKIRRKKNAVNALPLLIILTRL